VSSLLTGGRLSGSNSRLVDFTSSLESDARIARATVQVNEAHVLALRKIGVLSSVEAKKLLASLRKLEKRPLSRRGVEDIHLLIEEEVGRRVGDQVSGKLHTGKSRNDQVATAIRMVLREELLELVTTLLDMEASLLHVATRNTRSLFVGYTHLQPAQPVTFAHYILAQVGPLLRDVERLKESLHRVNLSPMGAAALAGSSFQLDRDLVARLLGFSGIVENSLDAVGSRDFVLEVLGVSSILASDLARICQDLIFYSSPDVGLIELPDQFASTSSIMPQKKNPDVLEVIRARCARVAGNFATAITTLHALPTGYNLDYQELTPLLWDSFDTLRPCVKILGELVGRLKLSGKNFEPHIELTAATEVANALVKSGGIPFRQAHKAVGRAVRIALSRNTSLEGLTSEDWGEIIPNIPSATMRDIARATNLNSHIWAYRTKGSPNPRETSQLIKSTEHQVKKLLGETRYFAREIDRSLTKLTQMVYHP
jgi:argininosuccinate lyase